MMTLSFSSWRCDHFIDWVHPTIPDTAYIFRANCHESNNLLWRFSNISSCLIHRIFQESFENRKATGTLLSSTLQPSHSNDGIWYLDKTTTCDVRPLLTSSSLMRARQPWHRYESAQEDFYLPSPGKTSHLYVGKDATHEWVNYWVNPTWSKPRSSPSVTLNPSIIWDFSATPTANQPSQHHLSPYIPGISAVSPPIRAAPACTPSAIPATTCSQLGWFILPALMPAGGSRGAPHLQRWCHWHTWPHTVLTSRSCLS